jgi:putative ABC transport system permease protein
MSIVTGVVFGLAPAFHASRRNLNESLSSGGRSISSGPQWLRSGMVVGEVALALILLAGAGLMIRSLSALMSVDAGFQTGHLLTAHTSLAKPASRAFGDELLARVERLPGVQSASLSSGLPMERVSEGNYSIEGRPKTGNLLIAGNTGVTETFFRAMGIPIRRGRGFTRAETEANEPAVVVVNDAFATRNWPRESPIGKVVLLPNGEKEDLRATVVGVIGNLHQMGPDAETRPELYIPSREFSDLYVAVRTAGDPMALGPAVERAVWSIDPQLPVEQIRSMQQVLHDWPEDRRFYMTVMGGFAGLALLLASLGLYGVLAYVVTLRTRELGIRVALGASSREVLRLVVGQGLRMTGLGIGIGLAGALLLTRLMQSLVFGVSTSDPATFAAVVVTLGLVALLASYVPARRATKVDPMQALRTE